MFSISVDTHLVSPLLLSNPLLKRTIPFPYKDLRPTVKLQFVIRDVVWVSKGIEESKDQLSPVWSLHSLDVLYTVKWRTWVYPKLDTRNLTNRPLLRSGPVGWQTRTWNKSPSVNHKSRKGDSVSLMSYGI